MSGCRLRVMRPGHVLCLLIKFYNGARRAPFGGFSAQLRSFCGGWSSFANTNRFVCDTRTPRRCFRQEEDHFLRSPAWITCIRASHAITGPSFASPAMQTGVAETERDECRTVWKCVDEIRDKILISFTRRLETSTEFCQFSRFWGRSPLTKRVQRSAKPLADLLSSPAGGEEKTLRSYLSPCGRESDFNILAKG
ncbi:hypothetical protein EDF70_107121 [Neorhizobium sp. JUb45]|nr:hypothetical protein EDF70_107121 [Neorhizobium sp. JUb45]